MIDVATIDKLVADIKALLAPLEDDIRFPFAVSRIMSMLNTKALDERRSARFILEEMLSRLDLPWSEMFEGGFQDPDKFTIDFSAQVVQIEAAFAFAIEAVLAQLFIYEQNTHLSTAIGDNLDVWGVDFSTPRYEPSGVIFGLRAIDRQGNQIHINPGVRFMAGDVSSPISFIAVGTATSGETMVQAETAGSQFNQFSGQILPAESINNLLRIDLVGVLIAGQDRESDEDYRARLIRRLAETAFGGNLTQYLDKVLGIEGVSRTMIYGAWMGGGTVKVSIMDGDNMPLTQDMVDSVKLKLDPVIRSWNTVSGLVEEVGGMGIGEVPIGHDVTVGTVTAVPIDIVLDVTPQSGLVESQIRPHVLAALQDYIKTVRNTVHTRWEGVAKSGQARENAIGEGYSGYRDLTTNARVMDMHSIVLVQSILAGAMVGNLDIIFSVNSITLNGSAGNITLISNKDEQRVPVLGNVTILIGGV